MATIAQNQNFAHKELSCHSTVQQKTVLQVKSLQDSDTLTSYASYLKELYSSMSNSHTSQHWTHLPRCEFIQLAMIGSGGLRREDREEEMVRLAQQGRIETILDHKTPIDLECLFPIPLNQPLVVLPPPPRPRVLLIEGAPGGGKSTLALHICHKWAQDDFSSFGRFDLVILVYLRDQAIQNATTLADILPARTLEMSQMVATKIQDSDGANVLFVFDGWDEFPHNLQVKSLVSTIIRQPHKLSLHQSTVLITSRPVSSGNLLHIADRRVEIMGFTQHQIREYVEKALDGNSSHIQKLVQHLEEHPVIEGYCYVPLHVAILVHIFLTMKGALPTTLHELFCNLVLCCIVRELDTHESESDKSEVCSLDDLPDDLRSKLNDLCVLAYEGVLQNKVVFYQKDLQEFNLPANLTSLGLLQAVEGFTLLSKSFSFNFLHLSIQELLAAYYISRMDSTKQIEVFKQMRVDGSRFQAVLQYYSGFTKLANPAIRELISAYSQRQSSIEDLLPLLHCFFEAQEPSLCKLVAHQFTKVIELNINLNPVDYLAIGYFVTSLLSMPSSGPSSKIILLNIPRIDNHSLKLLLLELLKYSISATSQRRLEMAMQENKYTHRVLKQQKYVRVSLIDPVLEELVAMLQVNKTCILTHLNLSRNSLSSTYRVFQGLQHNTTLFHLNLSNTGLVATEDTAQALTTMLKVNKTLTHLDLSQNQNFSDSGAYNVCQGLKHNTTLVYLNLSNTGITDKGAEYIAQAIESNRFLQTLDISRNQISDIGFGYIAKSLKTNTTLRLKKGNQKTGLGISRKL